MNDAQAILAALDPEQRRVATCFPGPVAVIAGAGTGKTRAITHRIAYGVTTGQLDARSTLAVTFTTRAAGELRGRLYDLGVTGVQARTFHSAALRQAQYFWPRAYGTHLPRVLDNPFGLVAEVAGRFRLTDTAVIRDLVGEISWTKSANVLPEAYTRLARAEGRSVGSVEPEQVVRVLSAYEAAKRERGVIDFDDIVLCAAALIADHEPVAQEIRRTYRHFVVDEYQDVSPIQQRLLDLWLGPRRDLCVVGDPSQTIHTFAGARSEYLTGFEKRHPDATIVHLVRDYRSTPQVVHLANQVMAGRQAVTLQAQQPPGPAVCFAGSPTEAAEAAGIADWLADRHREGVAWNEMAVLYRINAQSPAFEFALTERSIPYQVRGAERFYDRPEVRQAIAALRAQARTDPDGDGLAAFTTILEALGWTRTAPQGAGRLRERWESQQALADMATDVAAGATVSVDDLAIELSRRADAEHVPTAPGVTVATLHSAKGLEWEAVALAGVQEGGVPFVLATTREQVDEERRLLYVGITRARSWLRVSWSRTRAGGSGQRQPSRFLDGIRPADTSTGATPRVRRHSGSQALPTRCRICGKDLATLDARALGRHLDCTSDVDQALLEALTEWRSRQAEVQKVPAFVVFGDATLIAIAEACPTDRAALARISGVGARKLDRYGDALLALTSASR